MTHDMSPEMPGVDHFLNRTGRRRFDWLVCFVFVGGAIAVAGFVALLARTNGLI
jgi:hypothetical protein